MKSDVNDIAPETFFLQLVHYHEHTVGKMDICHFCVGSKNLEIPLSVICKLIVKTNSGVLETPFLFFRDFYAFTNTLLVWIDVAGFTTLMIAICKVMNHMTLNNSSNKIAMFKCKPVFLTVVFKEE